eukprot:CAMPEP_0202448488 /NCGR_PEP_ID=MMETSP1360-20130828/7301_1 /ASSEMBLY_ACC=CAM_ASM_000848 /TAXON_ID=515479 /ORGANISM="Licmophora paradoxa, Strain CCMP2313" /LENGTH=239 /DNA_ID=CAMNT_0049066081 /DNA_START=9 /DNA_END=728 /DNA_ORIENTATION=+
MNKLGPRPTIVKSNLKPLEQQIARVAKESCKSDEALTDEIPVTFPQRLMEMLDNDSHSEIMTWLPHGKAFIIYKKKTFAAEVLPNYFKQSKFTSFTRKLNRWGFTRITQGPETGAYFHKLFRRESPRLCLQMSCQNPSAAKEAIKNLRPLLPPKEEEEEEEEEEEAHSPTQEALLFSMNDIKDMAELSPPSLVPLSPLPLYAPTLPEIPDYMGSLAKSKASTRNFMMAIRGSLLSIGGF